MIQVEDAKEKNAALSAQKEDLNGKQIRLHAKLDELTTDNRFILIQLIFLWRYMMLHCCVVVVVFGLKRSPALARNLKSSLLEAERYREEYREVAEILALLKVS